MTKGQVIDLNDSNTLKLFEKFPHERERESQQASIQTTSLDFFHHNELPESEGAFDFVEDLLSDGAASVIYGASNSGKTFFALDLGAHVATGRSWNGKEVERGAVIYIALEGEQGAKNRIKAMKKKELLPDNAPFYLCFSPVNLLDPTHPEEIKRMIEKVAEKAEMSVRLVIIDTLARAMAGGDENAGKDMGAAVKTVDFIRKATMAHISIIHHCGKDAAKGARGHSSLRAAIDTEIEITHPPADKYRTATVVKQRDLGIMPPLAFSLEVVEVGTNQRGKLMTSCVVKPEEPCMAHVKGKPGAPRRFTCEMILELLPQRTIKEWQEAARKNHGMGDDAFEAYKKKCSDQWERTNDRGVIKIDKTLNSQRKGG